MTTNSLDQLVVHLNRAQKRDENIRITQSIGTIVESLDVLVTNNHDQLQTSVYRKATAESYILPYLSDYLRRIHRNIVKRAFFRAVDLCSNVAHFNTERLYIEMALLLNKYYY